MLIFNISNKTAILFINSIFIIIKSLLKMGKTISLLCSSKHSEEELISQYIYSMELSKIEVVKVYNDFSECIFEGRLDTTKYKQFVKSIVGTGAYQEIHTIFFENLLKSSKKNSQIKRIGSILCFLAEGPQIIKVKQLTSHIKKYYGDGDNSIKEFINDVIDINTDNCYLSFKSKIHDDIAKRLMDIWKKPRKSKLYQKIFENYESACKKYTTHLEARKLKDKEIRESMKEKDFVDKTNKLLVNNTSGVRVEEKDELCTTKLFLDLSYTSLEGKFNN
jgi:hypothetical protein